MMWELLPCGLLCEEWGGGPLFTSMLSHQWDPGPTHDATTITTTLPSTLCHGQWACNITARMSNWQRGCFLHIAS